MHISAIKKTNAYVNFTGDNKTISDVEKDYKNILKISDLETRKTKLKTLQADLDDIKAVAKKAIKPIKIPSILVKFTRLLGKSVKTGNKTVDTAKTITSIVLWGNVGKEAVGTTLYTVQALTNEDLPKDKRKFVGMYDLFVGVASTCISIIFGVGLQEPISKAFAKTLKPLTDHPNKALRGRAAAAIAGLSVCSSLFLQTIMGKRIIAPAIATPLAGRVKKKLMAKDAAKKAAKSTDDKTPDKNETKVVFNKQKFIDLDKSKFNLDK